MPTRSTFAAALLAACAPAAILAQTAADPAPPVQPVDPAPAQPAAQPDEEELLDEYGDEEEAIVITGERERGAVPGDIPPEIQLDSRDIRALGASNLSELLEALAPQVQSGRGRGDGPPVVLLNGKRISGISEIRNLPPEAVERVDILPEEVALKYGYRADQRVVNFVLRRRFRTITVETEAGLATDGGRPSYEGEVSILRIDREGRWNVDAEYERETALLESERNLIPRSTSNFGETGNIGSAIPGAEVDPALSAMLGEPVTLAAVPASALTGAPALGDFTADVDELDERRFRTLLGSSEEFSLNGTYSSTIFGNVSATANARFDQATSTSLLGLPAAEFDIPASSPFSPFVTDVILYRAFGENGALERDSRTRTAHAGVALNGDLSDWRWSVTGNYDRSHRVTRTDVDPETDAIEARIAAGDPALNPFAIDPGQLDFTRRDRTRSVDQFANAEGVLNGSLFELPAGEVSTTFKLGAETRSFESESLRGGIEQLSDLSRNRVEGQASVDIPIASRRRAILDAIGDLSVNGNLAIEQISDFGTLLTYGGGLNWSPIKEVRMIASITQEEGAPSVQQLGNPVEVVPNVRVFDFTRGETVDITRIEGGNPNLLADSRRVFKLGLNIRPLDEDDLNIRADFTKSRIRNLIASFPTATPEIEAAFPERFERDTDGQLLRIDSRPINFARADTAEIRWGINFSKPIASRSGFGGGPGGWRGRGQGGGRGGADNAPAPAAPPAAGQAQSDQAAAQVQPPAAQGSQTPSAPPSGDRPDRGPGGPGGAGGAGPGGPGGFRGGGFGGFGRGGAGQGGRLQFAVYHTWRLEDQVLIRPGVPEIDYLNGSAFGSRGGRSRHAIEVQAGIFKNGFGARLNANWQSATTVRGDPGTGGAGSGDLRFSDFATVNLRLFADLGQQPALVRKHEWLRGTRISLSVDNLFNSRLDVRDAAGNTPLSYQPAYLDPLGRSVRLQIRKMFLPSPRQWRREREQERRNDSQDRAVAAP